MARGARARAALTAVVLGYDVPPEDQDAALSEYLAVRDEVRAEGESVLADELDLLTIFADLAELSRNRPVDEDRHTELRVHSSREHFHTFLQSLDVERGGLPEQFRDRLVRVLVHYGVEDLERTPELEAAVFRIFLAQQRSTPEVALASAVLGCWSDETPPTGPLAARARALLERLGRVTQSRYPVIGDLARSVRFRWFDQPAVDAERSDILLGVRDELSSLSAAGDIADRARRIEALAAIPEQIVRFLAERLEHGVPAREPMLEVLARRHYREYDLRDLQSLESGARPFVVADYTLDDRPTRLVSAVGTIDELGDPSGDLVTTLTGHVDSRGTDEDAVADLYLHWADAPEGADETSEQLRALLAALPVARDVRRLCVAVCAGGDRPVGYYVFRPDRRRWQPGRGRPHPRRAPDGRAAPEPVAAAQLPRDPRRGARGRAALRLCRAREPGRPATGGPRAGPPDVRGPRRVRHGHGPSARRTCGGELPGVHPSRPRGARERRREAGHEPRLGPRLAGRRRRRDRADRAGHQDQPAHRRGRHRGGRGRGTGGRPGR